MVEREGKKNVMYVVMSESKVREDEVEEEGKEVNSRWRKRRGLRKTVWSERTGRKRK